MSSFMRIVGVAFVSVCIAITASASFAQSSIESVAPSFFIAPNGNDAWTGRLAEPNEEKTDGPFATFSRARDAVREWKASVEKQETIVVEVADGLYQLDETLTLGAEDSGYSADRPVVWRAKQGAVPRVCAGRFLPAPTKIEDSKVLERIKRDVRDKVVAFDLKDADVGDLGTPDNAPELFFQGEPTRLARYPNDGFVKIVDLRREGSTEEESHGNKGIKEGRFFYDDDELSRCADEDDLWFDGYWFWDWSQQKQRAKTLDPDRKLIELEEPHHVYGYRVGQWFYAFNALCELDAPCEYYIDRARGKLYFLPPTEEIALGDAMLTKLSHAIKLDGASHVVISGFEVFGARSDAIVGGNLTDVVAERCDVYNSGGSGISFSGVDCVVSECELWGLGRGGINLSGGDRKTLARGDNRALENYAHDYARTQRVYAPGISLSGVGNAALHNLVENAPHMGMGFSGNDHEIMFNEIANVCCESNDAGAIYTGRNWTMRGNVLRFNYLHDIEGFRGNGCVGIYLDDMFSSADIVDNLFVNVVRAAFIGGGRDCKINGNVFVDCRPAVHIDARGAGWARGHVQGWLDEAKEKGTISGVKYDEPPYSERYPELASILDDGKRPELPEGNELIGNVCVGGTWDVNRSGQWQGATIEDAARPLLKEADNLVLEEDDGSIFVDRAAGDYRFKSDSEPVKNGYRSLPVDVMGPTTERMKAKIQARRARVAERKSL